MRTTDIKLAILAIGIAGAAVAHTGASGIVKERMEGMASMGKAVKAITPVMRRQGDYDPDRVRGFAEEVRKHSGEALTALFPEGSVGMPSEAKPTIWTDWEEFEALAEQLHTLSEGLALAADNGLMASASSNLGSMMGSGGIVGSGGMTGGQSMMSGGPMMNDMGLEELSELPADGVFMMISQTCSACHTKFRAESN